MSVLEELQNVADAQSVKGKGVDTPIVGNVEVPSFDIDGEALQNQETPSVEGIVQEPEKTNHTEPDVPNSGSSKNVFASEEVAELNTFLAKNPDKSISDWQSLKRPTSEMDKKELLKKYFSEKEGMTENEIAYKMSQMEVDDAEEDDEFSDIDDAELLKRRALFDAELRKATEWREAYVAEQLKSEVVPQKEVTTPTTYTVEEIQREWERELQAKNKSYFEAIYGALPSIKSIDVEVGNEKLSYVPDEGFMADLKTVSEQPDQLWGSFQDENGVIKDPVGWLELLAWGNKATREKLISFRVEQAIQRDRLARSHSQRNVTEDLTKGSVAHDGNDGAFEDWYSEKRKSII